MDDFQFWLYVIIGIIYLLSRFGKKKPAELEQERETEVENRAPRPARPEERQMTFEELLKEITQAKTPVVEPKPQPVSSSKTVNYDELVEDEEQDLEDVNYDYRKKDSIYQEYETAKQMAFQRPSLEEVNWKDQKEEISFGKFKGFEEEKKPDLMALYLNDLKTQEGLKKAFVVSEIFKPKF